MSAQSPMPKYRCHKEVHALKIRDVTVSKEDAGFYIVPEEPYAPIFVSDSFVEKHNPQPGGYYVSYKDGYHSYSPAKAFEEGYTLIS